MISYNNIKMFYWFEIYNSHSILNSFQNNYIYNYFVLIDELT